MDGGILDDGNGWGSDTGWRYWMMVMDGDPILDGDNGWGYWMAIIDGDNGWG